MLNSGMFKYQISQNSNGAQRYKRYSKKKIFANVILLYDALSELVIDPLY